MRLPLDSTANLKVSQEICVARSKDGKPLGKILYNGWTLKGPLEVEQFTMTDMVPGGV